MRRLLIYGASGYTGRMASALAQQAGLETVLAGRDRVALLELAQELGLEARAFALDDAREVAQALADVDVLLNCAGPFARTAQVLMAACLETGTHYLDIAAELDSYQLAERWHGQALEAGVMLLPGCGGSVAMLGSLAAHALQQVSVPVSLRIAMHVAGGMSRGSAISASENISGECLMRQQNLLTPRAATEVRDFDFGNYRASCFPVTLPDLITIAHQSGIANIETFVHVAGMAFPEGDLASLPDGPDANDRAANRYQAAVEIVDAGGVVTRAALDTVNGYSFTPLAAVEAARRVLGGECRPGFQTPVGLFGSGFAGTIADTRIFDLPSCT